MRAMAIAIVLSAVFAGGSALAAPANVQVIVGEKMQQKARKTYGVDEVARLAGRLGDQVARELARTGAHEGARIELTLVDAVPNRPTFKQLGDRPGLSMESFGVGGAKIEGRIVAADGTVTPVAYKYYETNIDQAWANWTWSDADRTFDRFARRLSHGPALAMN